MAIDRIWLEQNCDTPNHIGGLKCVPIIGRVSPVGTLNVKVHKAIFSFQINTDKRYENIKI